MAFLFPAAVKTIPLPQLHFPTLPWPGRSLVCFVNPNRRPVCLPQQGGGETLGSVRCTEQSFAFSPSAAAAAALQLQDHRGPGGMSGRSGEAAGKPERAHKWIALVRQRKSDGGDLWRV